jgi:hypothetical protein
LVVQPEPYSHAQIELKKQHEHLTGIHLRSCIQDQFGHKLPFRHHNFLNIRS